MPRTLLWGENPKYYDTATMGRYWRWVTNGAIHPTNGYDGQACLTFDESTGYTTPGTPPIAEDPNIATIFPEDRGQPFTDGYHFGCGDRFYLSAYPAATTGIFYVLNVEQWSQLMLAVEPTGELSAYLSMGPEVSLSPIWTSDFQLTLNTHQKLGFWGMINFLNGWFDVYWSDSADPSVPAQQMVFVSGKITASNALFSPKGIGFGGTPQMRHSHMFVFSGSPTYTDPIRGVGFYAKYVPVVGAGTYSSLWTPNGAATIHEAIDDTAPDDDATVITTNDANKDFDVTVDDVDSTRVIYGVQTALCYKRPTAIAASLKPTVVVDEKSILLPHIGATGTDWSVTGGFSRRNPVNGQPWTRTRLNTGVGWGGRS